MKKEITVSPDQPPTKADSWERALDPFHVDASPEELKDAPAWHRGPRQSGWMLLDFYGNPIGWHADGSTIAIEVPDE